MEHKKHAQPPNGLHEAIDEKKLNTAAGMIAALMGDDLSDEERTSLQDRLYKLESKEELINALTNTVAHELLDDKYVEEQRKPTPREQRRLEAILKRIRKEPVLLLKEEVRSSLWKRTNIRWAAAAVLIPFVVVLGAHYAGWFGPEAERQVVVAENVITMETIAGVQKDVLLNDSSHVWVNAGSKITYPERFENTVREVHLEGEAYFNVCRDEQKPFIVHTSKIDVRVLGTEFNVVEDIENNITRVVLHTGSVEVADGKQSKILEPNQQLTYYHATGEMVVESIAKLKDWRSDMIQVNGRKLTELFAMIGNYYNMEFIFEGGEFVNDEIFSVAFGKEITIDKVMESLSIISGDFTYRIDNNRILVEERE